MDVAWVTVNVNVTQVTVAAIVLKNIAQTIASRAPLAVQASKKAITQGLRQSFEDAAAQEVADFAKLFLTKDAQEGCDAFVNKREAEWIGA